MKALVISGGGSKGAFAGGIAEYLINDCGEKYDLLVGSSTGSLLLPHLALGDIQKIKKIYTSVRQEDIFNVSPFYLHKNKEGYVKSINQYNILRNIIKGKSTFGESENLRKLISNNLSKDEFEKIRSLKKKVIVTVSNLTNLQVEFFNSDDCNYEDFCNWSWASANAVPYMSVYEHNGCQYADGGFGNHIPINCALENGVTEMDVIILESENETYKQPITHNPFSLLMQTFRFMSNQISLKDRVIGQLMGFNRQMDIHLYYTPRHLTDNPFIFEPELMAKWWEEGYEYAKSTEPACYCYHPEITESEEKIAVIS